MTTSSFNNSIIYIQQGTYDINTTTIFNNQLTLTIIGNGTVTIQPETTFTGRAYTITNGNITLDYLTFTDFKNSAIYNHGTLDIRNSDFTGNTATCGGVIYNTGSLTNLTGNMIKYNTANRTGAAINNYNAENVTITVMIYITTKHNTDQYT